MTSPAGTMRAHRSNMLDCIRTYAVMMVLIFHVCFEYGLESLDRVALFFSKYGFLGVDIFFPLSGFLITGYLLKNHDRAGIKVFFSRRVFRILPLYLLAILVYVAASLATGKNLESLHNIWQNILFLTGWVIFHNGREMVPYTITWSLSVEEFAYILIGISALFLRRNLPLALAALAVFSVLLRVYLNAPGLAYYYPPARLDSIAIGGLTAWAIASRKRFILPVLVCSLLVSLGLANSFKLMWTTLLFMHITLATCITIYLIQTYMLNLRNVVVDAIASIGFYSYFIYLFHYFNIAILSQVANKLGVEINFWVFVLLVLAATYVQAVLSFRYFEGPMMLFGRRHESDADVRKAAHG
jgi:peptidoglycan/LPS O-acetylase OafA/YrhL